MDCRLVNEEAKGCSLTNRVSESEVGTGATSAVTRGSDSMDFVSTRGLVLMVVAGECQPLFTERDLLVRLVFLVAEFSGGEAGVGDPVLRAECQAVGTNKQSTKSVTSKRNWGQIDFS